MDGLSLLEEARSVGLIVLADGDRLRIRGPRRAEPIAKRLLTHKGVVLAALSNQLAGDDPLPDKPRRDYWARKAAGLLAGVADPDRRADLRELFEHRAGVCEFDGLLDRIEAERIAFEGLRDAAPKKTDAS